MIKRELCRIINKHQFQGKTIVILGARQVGKTTLLKQFIKNKKKKILWLNGDDPQVKEQLKNSGIEKLKQIIGDSEIVVIDVAQQLCNTGVTIKLITDHIRSTQLLVSGSSAFYLTDKVKEALTGRKKEFHLFPLCLKELHEHNGYLKETSLLEQRLIYGMYPSVITSKSPKETLMELSSDYLYKDLFAMNFLRKPDVMKRLLQALAFQLGSQVSYNELSQIVGADKETIERYIFLLKEAYIVFSLSSLSRNLRNELKKSKKIYFYDNGIRNVVISGFNPINLRNDVGMLWENFVISERIKHLHYTHNYCNSFFWRNHNQQEIDYIEETNGIFTAYEIKYKSDGFRFPRAFIKSYKPTKSIVISRDNYLKFVGV